VGSVTRTIEGLRVRVVGDRAPAASARPLTPTLEDAYLWLLNGSKRERQDG
jgi:hypothetical protein